MRRPNGTNGADRGNRANEEADTIRGIEPADAREPAAIYRRAKRPMSRLSIRVCARTDPGDVVPGRRATFRTWVDYLGAVSGVDPVHRRLPDGACPQACPVLAESCERAAEVTDAIPGTHTWPPLPADVADSASLSGSVDLASRLVPLPCHRTVDEPAIRRAVARLR